MKTSHPSVIVRTIPQAGDPTLRFQVGIMETRPEQVCVFKRDHRGKITNGVVGYQDCPDGRTVRVFRLLGFGATVASAENMAGQKSQSVINTVFIPPSEWSGVAHAL